MRCEVANSWKQNACGKSGLDWWMTGRFGGLCSVSSVTRLEESRLLQKTRATGPRGSLCCVEFKLHPLIDLICSLQSFMGTQLGGLFINDPTSNSVTIADLINILARIVHNHLLVGHELWPRHQSVGKQLRHHGS